MDIQLVSKAAHLLAKRISPIFCIWKFRCRYNIKYVQFSFLVENGSNHNWIEEKYLRVSLESLELIAENNSVLNNHGRLIRQKLSKQYGDIDLIYTRFKLKIDTTREPSDTMILDGDPTILRKFLDKYLLFVDKDWRNNPVFSEAYKKCVEEIEEVNRLTIILGDRNQCGSFAQTYMAACIGELDARKA